jgi:hypothetical protein
VRVRAESRQASRIHTRNHTFRVGPPLSFEPSDELPSALEHLLGALAADLLGTLYTYARRRRVAIDAAELALTASLHNPLVHLGVIGEEGSPGLERVDGTLYASTDADLDVADALWIEVLQWATIYNTLSKAADIRIRFQITH